MQQHNRSQTVDVTEDEERMLIVVAAVALVQGVDGRKLVSAWRATKLYNAAKSTVHQHVQARRGSQDQHHKCDISFLCHRQDVAMVAVVAVVAAARSW